MEPFHEISGMIKFLLSVMSGRKAADDKVLNAMREAEKYM